MEAVSGAAGGRVLQFSLWVPWTPRESFEFFGDVQNLNRLTPGWFDLKVLSHEPVRPRVGSRIDYRLRWRGLPMRWQSVIIVWEAPRRIAYQQGRGPYRFFDHEHLFVAEGGGTRVIDRIAFEVAGGRVVRNLIVVPELRRIFEYRERVVRRLQPPSRSDCQGRTRGGALGAE